MSEAIQNSVSSVMAAWPPSARMPNAPSYSVRSPSVAIATTTRNHPRSDRLAAEPRRSSLAPASFTEGLQGTTVPCRVEGGALAFPRVGAVMTLSEDIDNRTDAYFNRTREIVAGSATAASPTPSSCAARWFPRRA